ncbi:hypothetical protein MY3296_004047 [Beauveria thailandica]
MAIEPLSVYDLVKAHARDRPHSIAISKENDHLTYAQLDGASRRIASLLSRHDVGPGDIVPVLTSRCLEMAACILAAIRLGAIWVPMELGTWSQERVETVLATLNHKVVLITADVDTYGIMNGIFGEEIRQAIYSDADEKNESGFHPKGPARCQDAAYIIFTSGTTGVPKGVVIAHESLLNYVWPAHQNVPFNLGATSSDISLLLFSVAFDAFYGVLFSTLCHGAQVLLSEPSTFIDDAKRCTLLPATPTLLGTIGDPMPYGDVRAIFLGGEEPPPELIRKWWTPCRKLWNAYGPTEATISITMGELLPDAPVSLGEPIRNSKVMLLDSHLHELSEVGLEGELCIAGAAVLALGYYKNSEQTEQKFIEVNQQRIYRTGDMAKKTKDGLMFLGRKDQMVKNRGFLINLKAEVVPALVSQPGVESATAVMYHQKLVAFITPSNLDGDQMRRSMSERFDQFLVPDEVHTRRQLPQTTNGKVDDAALVRELNERNSKYYDPGELNTGHKAEILRLAVADTLGIPAVSVEMGRSFVDLGGNSLLAIKLLSSLRQSGLVVSISSLFLLSSMSMILEDLRDVEGTASVNSKGGDTFPMTDVQKGMIRSTMNEPPAGYMLISISLGILPREFQDKTLSNAWGSVLCRYDLFHSRFDIMAGMIERRVEGYNHNWGSSVTASFNKRAVEDQSQALMELARRSGTFDTHFTPATAFRLVRSEDGESTLLWLVHHAIVDGWSVGTIVNQVRTQLSDAMIVCDNANAVELQHLSQFSHYSEALVPYLKTAYTPAKCFWTNIMEGLLDGTSLNVCRPEIITNDAGKFGHKSLHLGMPLEQAQVASRALGVSLAVVLHTAWAVLLSKYSGTDAVVFGAIFSGRSLAVADIENTVGPLINTCPFPVRMKTGTSSKMELLQEVQRLILRITEHQWSASQVMQEIAVGSLARVFSTALFLEYDLPVNNNERHDDDIQGQNILSAWSYSRTDWPEFGLTLQVQSIAGELVLRALFKKDQYEAATVSRMLTHFQNTCFALMSPITASLRELSDAMLSPAEMLRLTRNSPTLFEPYSGPANLKQAFELAVDQWPDAVAIDGRCGVMSYRQLDTIANIVAKSIKQVVGLRDVVALLGDGSCNWLVGVLSIIKAGATYLPLDTKLPAKRMQVMIETSAAVCCLFPDVKGSDKFQSLHQKTLCIQEILDSPASTAPIARLQTETDSDEYAYIMFTSGSTGTPKGIRVTHRATLSHLSFKPARMHASPGRRHAQIFSPGFDVNIAEIFGTLCYGATLVLKDAADPFAHLHQAHATMITPSLLTILSPTKLQNLDTIYLIGEAVPQALSDRWSVGRTLYNFYGPCECTIAALHKHLQPGEQVTLGRTVPRVGAYVLDPHGSPSPVGVVGEIYLCGIQVMEGYIGKDTEVITKRAFGPDPFIQGQRMYRTGDLGVWTESMDLRFLGRVDHQVKVRGYRVEMEEIENEIQVSTNTVNQAVAIVAHETIYAFVTPETANVSKIEARLRQQLPSYAVPQRVIPLQSFPTTPNQKLDRNALSALTLNGGSPSHKSLISSEMEQLLEKIWRQTIGHDASVTISSDDDFLAIGGNSLGQIRVAQQVCSGLELRVPLSLFILNTRLSALAAAIEEYCGEVKDVMSQPSFLQSLNSQGETNCTDTSYLEKEMFDMCNKSSTPSAFNVAHIVTLSGEVDMKLLKQAIEVVAGKSEALKTCYIQDGNSLQRKIRYFNRFQVDCFTLPCQEMVDEYIDRPFALASDQLTRIALLKNDIGNISIIFVQHHIITDQVSIRLFFQRMGQVYSNLVIGGSLMEAPDSFPEYPYSAWARWKASEMQNLPASHNVAFWKAHLDGMGRDSKRIVPLGACLMNAAHAIPKTITAPGSCSGSSCPIQVYLAATVLSFIRIFHAEDITVGIPFVDRTEPGTNNMLGLFLDTLPVRFQIQKHEHATSTMDSLVPKAQALVNTALAHAMPSTHIKEAVGMESLFDVMLVYNRAEDLVVRGLVIPGVSVEGEPRRAKGAKFPILVEFMDVEDGIAIEVEYFEEAISNAAVERVRDQICRILSSYKEKE